MSSRIIFYILALLYTASAASLHAIRESASTETYIHPLKANSLFSESSTTETTYQYKTEEQLTYRERLAAYQRSLEVLNSMSMSMSMSMSFPTFPVQKPRSPKITSVPTASSTPTGVQASGSDERKDGMSSEHATRRRLRGRQ